MTPDEVLIMLFEKGELAASDFRHEDHVTVAWGLAQRMPHEEAFDNLVTGIRIMGARVGRPEAFHMTVTRAFFELITAEPSLQSAPQLFDKNLLLQYYSPERLTAGRNEWLEPDLKPLR